MYVYSTVYLHIYMLHTYMYICTSSHCIYYSLWSWSKQAQLGVCVQCVSMLHVAMCAVPVWIPYCVAVHWYHMLFALVSHSHSHVSPTSPNERESQVWLLSLYMYVLQYIHKSTLLCMHTHIHSHHVTSIMRWRKVQRERGGPRLVEWGVVPRTTCVRSLPL